MGLGLERRSGVLGDWRTGRLMGGLDYVSSRYLVASDLMRSNFTTHLSGNKSAFLKYIAAVLSADNGGRFQVIPLTVAGIIKDAVAAAKGAAMMRAAKKAA